MMNHSFEKEVQHCFSTLPSHQHYFVYNLAKQPDDCASLTPTVDQQQSKTQVVHRLVLVTTTTPENDDEQLVSGLEVYEYTTVLPNEKTRQTIYISKIDTTGSTLARGVTRRLVQAYVATQQQHVQGECAIHVFARAQPQYLFPHSAEDTSKRVLTDRQLVAWWRTTLSGKDLYSVVDNNKVTPFWIVPGVDEQGALYDIGQKKQLGNDNHIEWRYGYPYAGDALAKDVIPRFEDDGKARYLGTLLDSTTDDDDDDQQKLTVDDFWTLFGYSEECGAGKLTGIFVIEISTTDGEAAAAAAAAAATTTTAIAPAPIPFLDDDEYTRIWNSLMALDFHDDQSNLKSTKTWLETWRAIVSVRSFAITTNQNNNNHSTVSGSVAVAVVVDDIPRPIQTLAVKRKPTSLPGQTPTATNTQSTSDEPAAAAINVLVPKRRKKEN